MTEKIPSAYVIKYWARKAEGMCPRCGNNEPEYGYALCSWCSDAMTRNRAKRASSK